jgi:ABC-type transport system involved in multi-copper enzyme maturation permease subunit
MVDNGIKMANDTLGFCLEDCYFNNVPHIGFFGALFAGLFMGTEYGAGTLRNKLVMGHRRVKIYMAQWLAVNTGMQLMLAAWLLGGLSGIYYIGLWQMPPAEIAGYITVSILALSALSAVYALVGMLCANKAAASVIVIFLFIVLFAGSGMVMSRLEQPEMRSGGYTLATNEATGQTEFVPEEENPNPEYISGTTREVYQFIWDLLPTGQMISAVQLEITQPWRLAGYSALVTAAVTAAGVFFFRRKDVK